MIVAFNTEKDKIVLDMNRIVAVLASETTGSYVLMESQEPIEVPIEVAKAVIDRWQGV